MTRLIASTAGTLDLDALPRVGAVRQRGLEMTRTEAFTDAAFAFALTLLVISFDEVPSNFDEFYAALQNIPAFAACFAQVAMFWWAHNVWSRRFGLDDGWTALISLGLVFTTLIFVFPLRLFYASGAQYLTNGWVQSGFAINTAVEFRWLAGCFGAAFFGMCLPILLLYIRAWRWRQSLGLDAQERVAVRMDILSWTILSLTGLLGLLAAIVLPTRLLLWSGFVYTHLTVTMIALVVIEKRLVAAARQNRDL